MILIIAAAPAETALLRQKIENFSSVHYGSYSVIKGVLNRREIHLAHGGIGIISMTLQLTRLLEKNIPEAVFLCGCGGCYPNTNLTIGDLVLATEEILGDTGVTTDNGFVPFEQLEIPQQSSLAPVFRQRIPLDPQLRQWARKILVNAVEGPFVTVNNCSGNPRLSLDLQNRTGGICENMEGAAASFVCQEFAVPLLEIRGISNPTGTRDPAKWDLAAGITTAQDAVLKLIQNWPEQQQ